MVWSHKHAGFFCDYCNVSIQLMKGVADPYLTCDWYHAPADSGATIQSAVMLCEKCGVFFTSTFLRQVTVKKDRPGICCHKCGIEVLNSTGFVQHLIISWFVKFPKKRKLSEEFAKVRLCLRDAGPFLDELQESLSHPIRR